MLRRASFDELGGTVWRSQAVEFSADYGLPTASVDRATHRMTRVNALVGCQGLIEEFGAMPKSRGDGTRACSSRAEEHGRAALGHGTQVRTHQDILDRALASYTDSERRRGRRLAR